MIPEQIQQITNGREVRETPYPGYYVTNDGAVISIYVRGSKARRLDPNCAYFVKLQTMKNGYKAVSIFRDGKIRSTYVHQLVLESFVGPRPLHNEACHKNGNRTDNRLENLRWDTTQANHIDCVNHGTFSKPPRNNVRGERNGNAKFTESDIRKIRELRAQGMMQKDIAAMFNTNPKNISDITRRYSWAWLE